MVGKTISHFRIVARIGEGGMGVVYRAILLLAAPAVLALDGLTPIGTIDFYGVRKASLEQIREAQAIREGDPAPSRCSRPTAAHWSTPAPPAGRRSGC